MALATTLVAARHEMTDELARRQHEIDEARELLRRAGAVNFGTLKEGIEMVLVAAKEMVEQATDRPEMRPIVFAMTLEEVERSEARTRAMKARLLITDEEYRHHIAFTYEVLQQTLALYERATSTNSASLLKVVAQQLRSAYERMYEKRRHA